MAKVICSQCGYYVSSCSGSRCSRYTIAVDKDTVCVDCDEREEPMTSKKS